MSKGVQAVGELVIAAVEAYFGDYTDAAKWAAMAISTWESGQADKRAKNAYNASLRDRYAMTRSTTSPRQIVFGRCRVSGPVFFASSYGPNKQNLTFCVALAAHEVDEIETIYFDDKPLTIDYLGDVTGVREMETFSITTATATVTLNGTPKVGSVTAQVVYGSTVTALTVTSVSGSSVSVSGATTGVTGELDIFYQDAIDPFGAVNTTSYTESFLITSAGQTFTLARNADAGTVYAVTQLSSPPANDSVQVTIASASGTSVTVSGAPVGKTINIHYQTSLGITKAKITKHYGTSSQLADGDLVTNFPGVWTSAHRAIGVAYLVVQLQYDDSAFSTGVPNVSAVIRGMKCFDPRTSTTAWTDNPALHARALATHPLAGNLPTSAIDDAAVIAAANVCDTSATYTLGTTDYVRPLYKSGYAFTVDRRPTDGVDELCQAMGGSWVFANGVLRISAGAYRTPVDTLDESWLVGDAGISMQAGVPRAQLVNTITATFADEHQDYRGVPVPRLSPPAYTAADGTTLPQTRQYNAVTFAGQVQYIASCELRRMRQGLTVTLTCNLRAWRAERFDVLNVSLARFGWVNKPFEVMEDTWTTDGAIALTLRETASTIYDMDAGFPDYDFAPNTSLPAPWGLQVPSSLAAVSGSSTYLLQADGTILPRILVSWDAITDPRVLAGGYVEIRYWRASDSANQYQARHALSGDTQAFLDGVQVGQAYIITARTSSNVTTSNWCPQILHTVGSKTSAPQNVAGAAYTLNSGRAHITWTLDTEPDYKLTELRVGASWAAGTLIGQVAGAAIDWVNPPVGATSTVWLAHLNKSGIYSATPASLSVVVDGSIGSTSRVNTALGTTYADGSATPGTVPAYSGLKFGADGFIYRREGDSSSTYVIDTSLKWFLDGTPPVTFKVRFDVSTQSGAGSIVGTLGTQLTLDSTHAQSVQLNKTGGIATATVLWAIYDNAGTTQIATGQFFLTTESS